MVIHVASQALTRLYKFIPAENLAESLGYPSVYWEQIMACTYKQTESKWQHVEDKGLAFKIWFFSIPNVCTYVLEVTKYN